MKELRAENREACCWSKYSAERQNEVEQEILKNVKTRHRTRCVKIKTSFSVEESIWTISLNEESKNTPLVLLHGLGAGLCFWYFNFDDLSRDRPVYAIDLLGFGRSSRPVFSGDPLEAERQMVEAVEEWRRQVELDRFVLLGHSFGGYLATVYAINHPDRVKHLILADPWGFTDPPDRLDLPWHIKIMGAMAYPFTQLNPLAFVRAAGPAGPWLVRKIRREIAARYGRSYENEDLICEYIYQCNSRKPTGETAFICMKTGLAWAKNPMIHRFGNVSEDIPVTILYGDRSWIARVTDDLLEAKRPKSFNRIQIIKDAGHQLNIDQAKLFNEVVASICAQEGHEGISPDLTKKWEEHIFLEADLQDN